MYFYRQQPQQPLDCLLSGAMMNLAIFYLALVAMGSVAYPSAAFSGE